mgnify:FL=1|tara:strand:+ start:294 stop:587 length:294 start_codon:yes stop_codon:yes gene_type:complete
MSFILKLLDFFNFSKRTQELQEMRKTLFAHEVKLTYYSGELLETQKILESISEVLAQAVLEQNAISAKVSIDQFDNLDKSDYAAILAIGIDDDDLLN